MGGNPDDKKSFIASARLKQLIKEEFALTFDIDVRARISCWSLAQMCSVSFGNTRILLPCEIRTRQDLCAQVGVVDGEKTGKVDFEKFTKLIALQPRQPVAKADPSDPFAKLGLA